VLVLVAPRQPLVCAKRVTRRKLPARKVNCLTPTTLATTGHDDRSPSDAAGYGSGLTFPLVRFGSWCYDARVGTRLGRAAEGDASDSTRALEHQQEAGT
jgi:hypothetical protein